MPNLRVQHYPDYISAVGALEMALERPSNVYLLHKGQWHLPDTTYYVWTMVKVLDSPRSVAKMNVAVGGVEG